MKIFRRPGPDNTQETLAIAVTAAKDRGLPLVVASTRGDTAKVAIDMVEPVGVKLIVVTHNTGFGKPGEQEFEADVRQMLEERGATVWSGTLVLRGVGSAIRKKLGGSEEELINSTLRIFCQGAKVCVEMAAMVADAGLVGGDTDIVTVAGTALGADTACVVRPRPSCDFFAIRVREFLCKPSNF